MSAKPFSRSRMARQINTEPNRTLTDAECEMLKLIAGRQFLFAKDKAVEHNHPSQQRTKRRPYRKQEKALHDRVIRLLAVSRLQYEQEIALKLALCSSKKPCRCELCWICKVRFANRRQHQAWLMFRSVPKSQLRHVTVLARVVYGGIYDIEETIAAIKKAVRDAIYRAAKDNPDFLKLQWMGYFEIDVYRPDGIDLRSRKGKTMANIDGFDADSSQLLQLVHFHLLVALNGLDKNVLRKLLKRLFPGRWRVKFQVLDRNKSKKESVRRLAAYMSKCHPVYQDATLASDKAPRGRGRYDCVFNDADLSYYARLQEHHGGLGGAFKFDLGLR